MPDAPLAGDRAAGEGDERDVGVADYGRADAGAQAKDEIAHACWHACRDQHLRQEEGCVPVRPAAAQRARTPVTEVISLGLATTVLPVASAGAICKAERTTQQAVPDLPCEQVQRQVPRRDEARHADRLPHRVVHCMHDVVDARPAHVKSGWRTEAARLSTVCSTEPAKKRKL